MRIPTGLAALIALMPLAAQAQVAPAQAGQDRVVRVAAADPEMNAAIARARAELPVFFGHVTSPAPGETQFSIKYDLIPGPAVEFIWAEVISHADGQSAARLINQPGDKRFRLGQQVTVRDAEVIDWSYRRGGVMQGSYSTRVLLPRLPAADAEAIRKNYGW